MLINTPANPRQGLQPRRIEGLAALACEHDLFVLTDEIYEHFLYDGAEHVSPLTLPGMRERTIVIRATRRPSPSPAGASATSSPTPSGPPAIGYFHDLTYVCAPAPLRTAWPTASSSSRRLLPRPRAPTMTGSAACCWLRSMTPA